jgi:cobalamin transport system substrate-binding protein
MFKRWMIGPVLALALLAGCAAPRGTVIAVTPPAAASGATATAAPTEAATTAPTEAAAQTDTYPVTVKDGTGADFTLDQKPQRIVSLTLGTDEVLLDLVGPERLVAVTYLADDKTTSNIAGRPELAQIKGRYNDDPEQVLSANPDLVVAGSFTKPDVLDQLRKAGLKVYVEGNFTSIEAMKQNVLTLGKLVGEDAKAQAIADDMDKELAEIADKLKSAPAHKPTVLYLASDNWAAGSATTVDDIIIHAGGVNAASMLNDWNQISPEKVVEINPDVVILSPYVADADFVKNPAYQGLSAIQNHRVAAPSDAHLSATSQYIILAVQDVAKVLYPDLFK